MARTLSEIILDIVPTSFYRYITKDGRCLGGPSDACMVEYELRGPSGADMPEAVSDYLMRSGLKRIVTRAYISENRVTLRRLSDGKEETFPIVYIAIESSGGKKPFLKVGFKPGVSPEMVKSYYISPDDLASLRHFLTDAGVEFRYDVPPWLEVETPKVKPSSRRPGKEAEHLFGFA